jgi:hypothetical protein
VRVAAAQAFLRNEMIIAIGIGERVGSSEFSFLSDGVAPEGDGDDVFDGVAFFAAVVFAIGEGVIFGRHAVGEVEEAADLLGRMDRAPGFVLGISKEGDLYLRKLLVQGAHYILGQRGPDTDLKRWGRKLSARGGQNAKKRAIVAVARKLAILLHRLWVTGEVYEPLRNSMAPAAKQKVA